MEQKKPDHVSQEKWDAYMALPQNKRRWHLFCTPEFDGELIEAYREEDRKKRRDQKAKENPLPTRRMTPEETAGHFQFLAKIQAAKKARGE